MQPNTLAGPGAFRCGCGAGVRLTGLPRLDQHHCTVYLGERVCNGPKKPDHITCEPCAVKISRNALVYPETAEQIAAHLERVEFLKARRLEEEALNERHRAEAQERYERGPRRDRARRAAVVYYCRIRDGVVKIGTTSQIYVRMDAFRVADGDVLAAEPGSFPLEGVRHRQFEHLRISADARREDFRLDDQLQSHIDMLVDMYGQPFDLVEALLDEQGDVAEAAS
jgi:hypothetical protein